jgi:hypothetical protein
MARPALREELQPESCEKDDLAEQARHQHVPHIAACYTLARLRRTFHDPSIIFTH